MKDLNSFLLYKKETWFSYEEIKKILSITKKDLLPLISSEIKWEHLLNPDYRLICSIISDLEYIEKFKWENIDRFWHTYKYPEKRHNIDSIWFYARHGFVVSKIDNKNKYSEWFKNCTSLIVVWEDKETWENISFLTHQDPAYFLSEENSNYWIRKESFINAINKQLDEIKKRSKPWTIDIVILWWHNGDGLWKKQNIHWFDYYESLELLDYIVYKKLKFHPVVIWWASNIVWYDEPDYVEKNIYLDTSKRRIFYLKKENLFSDIIPIKNYYENYKNRFSYLNLLFLLWKQEIEKGSKLSEKIIKKILSIMTCIPKDNAFEDIKKYLDSLK